MRLIDADKLIEELFNMQPATDGWIKYTGKMPRFYQECLVSCSEGEIQHVHIDRYGDWCSDEEIAINLDDVLAWQPLPEPYKESED